MMSDIQERDSEEEAGSMEVSQLDNDVTRSESKPSKSQTRPSMDNVLESISSKTQLEEEVKRVQNKQEDEPRRPSGLNQSSAQPINPRKLTSEKEDQLLSTGAERKKPGFAKLFDKGNKVIVISLENFSLFLQRKAK